MAGEEYYDLGDVEISMANGAAQLTDFDNAQAALVDADIRALDYLKTSFVSYTDPIEEVAGPTTGHYQRVVDTGGRKLGHFNGNFYLQTGILTGKVLGGESTAEATPNVHTLTKMSSQIQSNFALYLEKNKATNDRLKELMGFVHKSLDITCSEKRGGRIATQNLDSYFAYSADASDLTSATALTQATHKPYTWSHYKNSSGTSAFTYNTGALGYDITGFNLHFGWSEVLFGQYDANGYPNFGKVVGPFELWCDLAGHPRDVGTDIFDITKLKSTAYAGDLKMIIDFYESGSRNLIYTMDKMRIITLDEKWRKMGNWYDDYDLRLVPLNESTTFGCVEENALNNDYYLNPA